MTQKTRAAVRRPRPAYMAPQRAISGGRPVTADASSAGSIAPAGAWLRPTTQRDYLALGVILIAAAAIRFWDLAGPSYWVDELYSLNFAGLPHGQLWSEWMVREPVPPLYYSLLRGWTALFGDGEFAARSLSALFGV